ncbi:Beta-barrel assembly machine subunit BamB [Alteromonadaceae bacterium Bs31]|nr:Beta-barrel assembly machine subunit BamB [Alteromonadaceae bacterium Bs31]
MRRFLVALMLLGLSACDSPDPKEQELEAAKLTEFERTVELKRKWTRNAGSGQDERFSRYTPAIDEDGYIYTIGVNGDVHAFSAEKGKRRWSVYTKQPISGGVSVNSGNLVFGTYDGFVFLLDSETGEQRWQAEVSSEVASAPAVNGDLVVANTIDGRVFAFEASSGELRWSFDHTTPVLTLRGNASPILTSSQVLVAFDNGQVLSLSASDGSMQWQLRVSRPKGRTELDRIVDIDGTPVLDAGYLYAASFQGNIVAITRGSGRMAWSKEGSTANNLVVHNGRVFVSAEDSRIFALNSTSGELEWETMELKRRGTGTPAVIGDYLAVADTQGYVHVLSQEDGTMAYRFKPRTADAKAKNDKYKHFARKKKPKGIRSPLFSYEDSLYIFADSGKLTAFTLAELK